MPGDSRWAVAPEPDVPSATPLLKSDDAAAPVAPTDLAVGLATCGAAPSQQAFAPLVATTPSPIKLRGGGGCISAAGCADRSPTCHLNIARCDPRDAFQLFSYNASSGWVRVPPAAAGPKAPAGVPQCFNVNCDRRIPGYLLDVFDCGGPGGPGPGANAVAISQDASTGQLRLRDVPTLCLAGGVSPKPPPAPAPPPPPPPHQADIDRADLECGLRILAFEMARRNLEPSAGGRPARNLRAVWDQLELGTACIGSTRNPPPRPAAAQPPRGAAEAPPADAIFVDAVRGSDAAPGHEQAPLRTVEKAVELAAQRSSSGRVVVLRGGTHRLARTLRLGPSHSGLVLRGYPGEQAVLSGGLALSLDFRPAASAWWAPGAPLLVADLPADTPAGLNLTELFIGQDRYVKARWPDANPFRWPEGLCTLRNCSGFTTATGTVSHVGFINGSWLEPEGGRRNSWNVLRPDGSVAESAWWVLDHYVTLVGGSGAARFDPPEDPSASAFGLTAGRVGPWPRGWQNRSRSVAIPRFSPRAARWSRDGRHKPLLHAFNGQLTTNWGNHIFEIDVVDVGAADSEHTDANVSIGLGGWHMTGAWGGSEILADHCFVEGVLEELTQPGEWLLRTDGQTRRQQLWIYPSDRVGGARKLEVVLAGVNQLVRIDSANNITVTGLTFAHTAQTWVPSVGGRYAVNSNGDFTANNQRGGAVWIGESSGVTIRNSLFSQLGGSGVMMYGAVSGCTIDGNEFAWLGEGGVTSVGRVALNNATAMNYPRRNRIVGNHFHHLGLWVKAVAGVTQFLSARNTISENVIYATPRSSILLNDNMGGGNVLEGNLLFDSNLETSDHGPLSSWSRMPYINLEGSSDGRPTVTPAWNLLRQNFVCSGFSPDQRGNAPFNCKCSNSFSSSSSSSSSS